MPLRTAGKQFNWQSTQQEVLTHFWLFSEEEAISLKNVVTNIGSTNKEIKEANNELLNMLNELTFSDEETKMAVDELMKVIKEV